MVARSNYSVFGIIPANGLVLYGYQRVWVLLARNNKRGHFCQTDIIIKEKGNCENRKATPIHSAPPISLPMQCSNRYVNWYFPYNIVISLLSYVAEFHL
jgi:hypothetical protein